MKAFYKLFITLLSFVAVESFIKPMFISKNIRSIAKCKYHSDDYDTLSNKYFLVHSLINYAVLKKHDLFLDYCYKNLNYTDVMHIVLSQPLESIIMTHHKTNTTLELYDIIKTKSRTDDCSVSIFSLKDYKTLDLRKTL